MLSVFPILLKITIFCITIWPCHQLFSFLKFLPYILTHLNM